MKKAIRFIMLCMLAAIIILSSCGCINIPKTYSGEGITITMGSGFKEKAEASSTIYWERSDAMLKVIKETFSMLATAGLNRYSSLLEYMEAVLNNNDYGSVAVQRTESDKFLYMTYEYTVNNVSYFYLSAVYKGTDAFWLCTFASLSSEKEKFEPKFLAWAETVTVA
ncbi:MAG: hypothetical protein EOM87_01950 [Clostridia bacterium]|nr:hypothetical protein [Clostridia bacterium]